MSGAILGYQNTRILEYQDTRIPEYLDTRILGNKLAADGWEAD